MLSSQYNKEEISDHTRKATKKTMNDTNNVRKKSKF